MNSVITIALEVLQSDLHIGDVTVTDADSYHFIPITFSQCKYQSHVLGTLLRRVHPCWIWVDDLVWADYVWS